MKRLLFSFLFLVGALALALAIAGCGGNSGTGDGGAVSTSAQPTVTTTTGVSSSNTTIGQGTTTVRVYFAQNEKMTPVARDIGKTASVGDAAVKALLAGPNASEKSASLSSAIPTGTKLLGLTIENGVATVNLSKEYASGGGSLSMSMRLAQVVFTLTQLPTVKGVNFQLDGKAVKVFGGEGIILDHAVNRADYEDLSPAILAESPLRGQTVSSPVRIYGTANVFEAQFNLEIKDAAGKVIASNAVHATSGTGTRGTFDIKVTYTVSETQQGTIVLVDHSEKDGSRVDVIEIPVILTK